MTAPTKTAQRPPDWHLRIRTPSGATNRVGCAWTNEAGHLNMRIDPGVVLDWRSLDGCLLTLFPADKEASR